MIVFWGTGSLYNSRGPSLSYEYKVRYEIEYFFRVKKTHTANPQFTKTDKYRKQQYPY